MADEPEEPNDPLPKPLVFAGSSRKELKTCPEEVQGFIGHTLWHVQMGETPVAVKPLKGFGGAGVLEVIADDDGDTYRAVYTVKFAEIVYVLHVFQKKSVRGKKTPPHTIELVKSRLKWAKEHHENWKRAREEEAKKQDGEANRD